jgi:putative protease
VKVPELLAPAGNLEKLKGAVIYGANAVYFAGERFGLRAMAPNFTHEELKEGVNFAKDHDVKTFVTVNIIPHNEDLEALPEYLLYLESLGVDGIIVSDLGILELVKETTPGLDIHISTQANNTNWKSVNKWHQLGAKRVILARELSLKEIKEIREKTPPSLELEAFVHGAMCISYSGRCLLSNYMANRDANRGECVQSCRWKYNLVEETRPGQYFPIYEDEKGTYIMNSTDLSMINHIPELMGLGLDSFKIEGRMKSIHYVATIVNAYRNAIDSYIDYGSKYVTDSLWDGEVRKVSHRPYNTGFYFGKPSKDSQVYHTSSYIREYDFVALVLDYLGEHSKILVEQRNNFSKGEELELLEPGERPRTFKVMSVETTEGERVDIAPHPQQKLLLKADKPIKSWSLLRRTKGRKNNG